MDLLLIKNADVYAPSHLGRQDVLISGGKIVKMGTDLEASYGSLSVGVNTREMSSRRTWTE